MEAGLAELKGMGAAGCVVLGSRLLRPFRFRARAGVDAARRAGGYFMARSFGAAMPSGEVCYHPAFVQE